MNRTLLTVLTLGVLGTSVEISSRVDSCTNKNCTVASITGNSATFGILDAGQMFIGSVTVGLADAGSINTQDLYVSGDIFAGPGPDFAYSNTLTYIHTLCFDSVDTCNSYMNVTGSSVDLSLSDMPIELAGSFGGSSYEMHLTGDGGSYAWTGLHVDTGGIEWGSGTGALFQPGSALDVRGVAAFADAGFGGNVSIGGDARVVGRASVDGVLEFLIADGGTLHLSNTIFVPAIEVADGISGPNASATLDSLVAVSALTSNGTLTSTGVFKFGIADGGTLHLSGPAYVAGNVTVGGTLSVAGLSSLGSVDAGSVAVAQIVSPGRNLSVGSWSAEYDGVISEDTNFLPPWRTASPFPPRFGLISCASSSAGADGTTGLVVAIVNVTDATTLCSCTLGTCTTPARSPLNCACNAQPLPNKDYAVQITSATDCTPNPQGISCTVQQLL